MALADDARQLWSAAFFYRRAPDRDRTKAVTIIRSLTQSNHGKIAQIARSLLEEIENERTRKN